MKKCALLKRPPGKILDLLEVSDLISNQIDHAEEKKCVLRFECLNGIDFHSSYPGSIRLKSFWNSRKRGLSVGFEYQ